jgi:phosphate starvation-inducible protein PhoH
MSRKVSTPLKTTAAKSARTTRTTRTKKTETKEIVSSAHIKQDLLSQIKIDLKHKNEVQKKLTQSIKNGDVTICTGPAGTGKAQPLDSLILTPKGYVKMCDINVGDEVIGVNGTPILVDGVYPQGEKEIYLISFSDGTQTECCGEHLWFTQTYEERNKRKRVTDDNGKRIYIGKNPNKGSVRNTIDIMNSLVVGKKSQKVNHSIPIVKQIEFKTKEVTIDPYLLGCLLGDGGFTTPAISLTTNDVQIVETISNILPKNHILKEKYGQNYIIKSVGVKKNDITEYLREVNLFGLTSSYKFIPEEYLINDTNTRLEILRGLLDTDGSVDTKTGTPLFYSTSEKLIDGVTFIVQSLGGIVKKTQKIGKYRKLNGEVKECKVIYSLHINLPLGVIPFKLDRKINLMKQRVKYFPIRYIKNVELIGKKKAQCISVNDENHLYLTNDCIVTHNTLLSVAEALILLKTNPEIYYEIKLVKSIVQLKDEDLGTLPGDERDKLKFIMMSFFDAFYKLIGEELTNKLLEAGYIKMEVFGSIRGRSLSNCIVLFDEFQNVTDNNGKTLLTRFSENTKVIALGDSNQVDLKKPESSCLGELVRMAKLHPEEGVNVVEFTENEVVRHRLTKYFINIFEHKDYKKITVPKPPSNRIIKESGLFSFLNFFKKK